MRQIKVKTQFEDFHRWADAPEEVAFLRNLHRHIFGVMVHIDVHHDDRELEFFMVQRYIQDTILCHVIPMPETKSCEMMAEKILDFLELKYPNRTISVEVNEDWENGSIVDNKTV